MNKTVLTFPKGFLWGTATSTTQIEGHIDNEWTNFVARDGTTCHPACDSYHRYAEDVEWMTKLGVNAYRFGIEWSRLQQHAFGKLNQQELARYCDNLDRLIAANITPMVVLHHFSNPPWINRVGGWTNESTVAAFVDFATKLVETLRSRVRIWNTFNEPDTYACCGYLIAEFPPLKKFRVDSFRTVVRNMAEAHRQVCEVIQRTGSTLGSVEVGFSKNWTFFEPYRQSSLWDVAIAAFAHSQLNEFVLENFLEKGRSNGATFIGVNYYGRIRFRNLQPLVPTFGFSCDELAKLGVLCDDMLERYPVGIESALRQLAAAAALPIYVTEHGSASGDEAFRENDLRLNLVGIHRALMSGVDLRGFFYWSLLDNFEWQFGHTKKFGLLDVNFDDPRLPRKLKRLGDVFGVVCRENGVRIDTTCFSEP
jgi:beta-glucosidase